MTGHKTVDANEHFIANLQFNNKCCFNADNNSSATLDVKKKQDAGIVADKRGRLRWESKKNSTKMQSEKRC